MATAAVIGVVAFEQGESSVDDTPAHHSPASGATSVAAAVRTVTCWNGVSAAPRDCPIPWGRAGMKTVFPALTASCDVGPAPRRGALEVFVCRGDGNLVRYTRWQAGFDRFRVFDRVTGQTGSRWSVGGQFAGRDWTSPDDAGGDLRWAATYRADPYSVEVVADNADALTAGRDTVQTVRPGHIGRR